MNVTTTCLLALTLFGLIYGAKDYTYPIDSNLKGRCVTLLVNKQDVPPGETRIDALDNLPKTFSGMKSGRAHQQCMDAVRMALKKKLEGGYGSKPIKCRNYINCLTADVCDPKAPFDEAIAHLLVKVSKGYRHILKTGHSCQPLRPWRIIKSCDFGLAKEVLNCDPFRMSKAKHTADVGTVYYMAPEN
ncbi:unnamed protein product [Oppiella nova]|uniref:Uncharacterized protein n=1 Tax=Oppiella nova TaxID=334625 RepID=A0A7R9M5L7_9ACAR|nr:unnamed protein product [Oppiella nova]CAG2171201.1 unnamed protein product [Oppiella nova]